MDCLDQLFQQFLRERVYLHNITPKTREFYETAWKAFTRSRAGAPPRDPAAPLITHSDLQDFVIRLRERHEARVVQLLDTRSQCFLSLAASAERDHRTVRLPPQKLEKRIVPTHDDAALRALLRVGPKTFAQWGVYAVACTLVDAGCRIEELLTARVADFAFDNLLLTVVGNGRKRRRVPLGIELREVLFRFA